MKPTKNPLSTWVFFLHIIESWNKYILYFCMFFFSMQDFIVLYKNEFCSKCFFYSRSEFWREACNAMFMYIVSDRFCVSTSFIYIYISKKGFFVLVQGLVPIAIQKKNQCLVMIYMSFIYVSQPHKYLSSLSRFNILYTKGLETKLNNLQFSF